MEGREEVRNWRVRAVVRRREEGGARRARMFQWRSREEKKGRRKVLSGSNPCSKTCSRSPKNQRRGKLRYFPKHPKFLLSLLGWVWLR